MNTMHNEDSDRRIEANILILGGGPAGIQAARFLKLKAPDLRVTVLRPEPHSMVYCALPYAVEGLFPLSKTFKSDQLLTEVGAELIRATVKHACLADKTVHLDDGRSITYEKLLIVTGAIPVRPNLPGVNLANVFTIKTAEDTLAIMTRLGGTAHCDSDQVQQAESGIVAVVVGSGAIGIEQAIAYRNRGVEVHLVERCDHVLPNLIDVDMSGEIHRSIEELGIHLHLNASLKCIQGRTEAEIVELSDNTQIKLQPGRDLVMLAVGMRPDVKFLNPDEIILDSDGIVIDNRMRTSVPDVWAAGDCASGWSGIDMKPLSGKLATNAVPMAKVAAKDILGLPASFPGFFNGAATIVGKWRIAGTGFTETVAASRHFDVVSGRGQSTTRFPMMPDAGEVRVKLLVECESGRIVGGQVIGSEAVAERIDLITLAIQQGMTANGLSDLSYSAQPWQTFFPAKNAIVEAATNADAMISRNVRCSASV